MKKLIVIDAGNSDIVVALILNFKITIVAEMYNQDHVKLKISFEYIIQNRL